MFTHTYTLLDSPFGLDSRYNAEKKKGEEEMGRGKVGNIELFDIAIIYARMPTV